MPRGVYQRKNKSNTNTNTKDFTNVVTLTKRTETDAEVDARIAERFDVLEDITKSVLSGNSRSLIVSGPPGLGKSFTIEKLLEEWGMEGEEYTRITGYVKATGLYKLLYQYRNPGNVVVFDDADSVFLDDVALSLLKAVADTTETRRVSWLSEAILIDEESADVIPKTFEFNGSIIFITNQDFDAMIDKGSKLAPHFSAMMSRSHYIDLSMKTRQDYMIRIRQVVKQGLLAHLEAQEQSDVIEFLEAHTNTLRELSLRMAIKLGNIRRDRGTNWERNARITCLKQ